MNGFSRILVCTIMAVLPALGPGPASAQLGGDRAVDPLAPRCGTPDREIRELLYGFPFDPSDCSATETNPTPDYDPGALYEIPVVVHIIMDDSCTQGEISDDLVHSQIEILNEDFLALPGTNGENGTDAQIQFVLASEDPDGNPTEGITRDCNTTWFNDNGAYWNELAWDPHNYLNIYTNQASGALGYVPFLPADGGGGQVGQPHDRVVILWDAFGRDAPIGPPYDQGRTATHEVGHFLGLEHTFTPQGQCGSADPPGCFTDGDLICDTEVELNPRFGCPVGAESCGSIDPIENYMDYSDDLCMELFTLEQMRRNRCTLQFYRPDLYNVVGSAQLVFDPSSLEFGDVEVGTTSPPQTAMLQNIGDADATGVVFSGLPDAGFESDTSACGDTLPAGESCAVSVTFTPATEGPATATLHVAGDEDVAADLSLSGNGISGGEGPIADISPESFSFEVPAGGSDSDTLNVGNVGDADLVWSIDEAEGTPGLLEEWSDDFDGYATGSQIHGQGGWKGWFNDPAAGALVSDVQAQSTPNSVEIVGASDLVHEYVDSTSGQWTYTAWQYIPTDFTGITYFILLNSYDDAGSDLRWSTQVQFDGATDQVINDGASGGTLSLIRGQWVEVRVEIDLDADTQDFFYNGELLYSGTWTNENTPGGALNIGAVDLFANGASAVYYDDLSLAAAGGPGPGGCAEPTDVPWLAADPTSGTTPPAGSVPVDVTVDAAALEPGGYTAQLCVTTNDSNAPLVEVLVNLTVTPPTGGPIADITPESFSFEVPQGESAGDTLNVGNIGDADLTWAIEEAEPIVVPEGAPYRYGLAATPEFRAPVGFDRASGISRSRGEAPATPIVPPAPQELALGDFSEGFDDVTQLPGAGWALINNSEPLGPSSWFQGNETIFPAHEGEPDAYIAANFESVDDVGTISNWLITPEVTIVNGTTITFWTRKAELFGEFADRMEVRMSIAGDSTDVGDTAESVGDFTEVLLTINPDLIPGEYPQEWTQFTLTVRERSREPVTGRFAFRYWVTDAGPDGTNADYIGIDTVGVKQPDGEPPGGGCDNPLDIPWLAADPTSGTTPPAGSVPVDVTVDTTGLEVGDYAALLCVTTNDPNAPQVKVPVDLMVIGGGGDPVIDVDPDSLSSTLPPNGTETQPLTIANLGDGTLDWEVTEDGALTGRALASAGRSPAAGAATRDERRVLQSASRRAPDAGSGAAVDLVSVLGKPLPSVRVVDPANGVVDCEGEPGIIIHDDGTIENAYTGNPTTVSEVRFVDLFTPSAYPATFSSVCLAFISLDPPSLDFEIVVFDDDGTDGAPGTELGSLAVTADGIPSEPGTPTWFSFDISSLGITVEEGSVYIGARWSPETAGLVLIGADESTGNPPGFAGGHWWENNSAVWAPIEIEFTEYRSLMVRAVEAPVVGGDCELPTWLSVDPTSGSVPAGGSQVVDVTFDATGLAPGDYEANLCIASNDPVTPLVTVPVSLTVTPEGELTCFVAELDGDQEVPPVPTSATGHGDFTYDFDTMELTWEISHTLDLADMVAAHLHVAPPGEDGPVDIPLDHTINPIVGSTTLTAEQETNLTSGLYYANLHTISYPDGEIRGQILECEPQAGGSLTTLFASDNGFAGNTFDLAPAVPLEITGFDVNVVSNIDETITIYWKEGTAEGFDSDPSAWTVLGSDTVTPAGLDQPTHVEVGGLQLEAGEVYGFYVDLESYELGVSTLHYTDGPPTEFSNADLTLTTLVGKANPAFEGTTFPDRMWNGTVYYDFSGAPATRSLKVGSSR